jgi:thymidylate synthase (FAD)
VIQVLDKGYVALLDVMGSDLTPVNAARVSMAKRSTEMSTKDERLLEFLGEHDHTSPFRHAMLQFEVKAPLLVARQWWKYTIGSGHQEPLDLAMSNAWNEVSRRYVQDEPEFYIPTEWRSAPENKKQGSGPPVDNADYQSMLSYCLDTSIKNSLMNYHAAIQGGVCVEQARLFLPAYAMYTSWYWTASLQAVCHFLRQRLKEDAQFEIREYAKAVLELVKERFPLSVKALLPDVAGVNASS